MKYIPFIIAVAIFCLDLIERLAPVRSSLTFYLWLLGIGVITASVIASFIAIITQRSFWTPKNLLGSVAVLVLLATILSPPLSEFDSPITMHPESTRQASCGIKKLHDEQGVAKAAYSWCFLGYNTRQYIPQAVLFDLLGPSAFALNAPYIFFIVLGFLAYVVGLKTAVDRGHGSYLLLMTALLVPLQSYYYFFLTFAYEQSVFPFGLTLLALGVLLQCAFQFRIWNVGIGLLCLQHLLFSYTPAVSVYFFAAGMLSLVAVASLSTARARWGAFAALMLYAAAHFWISLAHRADIRLLDKSHSAISSLESTFSPLFKAIFYTEWGKDWAHSNAYSMGVATVGLLLILIFTNSKLRILGLCALAWSAAHLFLAAYSKGYAAPPIPFALHRALPILPVLGLIIFFGFGALRNRRPRILLPLICLGLLWLHGTLAWYQSRTYDFDLRNRRAHNFPHAEVLDQIYKQLSNKNIDYLTIGAFFENTPHAQTFPDYASYYFPRADHQRNKAPVVPPRPNPTAPFVGLYVGGVDETEPFASGATALPEGLILGQVIRIPQVKNASQALIAYTYEKKSDSPAATTK